MGIGPIALVLAIVIPCLVVAIAVVIVVAVVVFFCYKRRKARILGSKGVEKKDTELNISFPLPKPSTYNDEITMDETQHSPGYERISAKRWVEEPSKELVKPTKVVVATMDQAGASETSEKSEKTEKSEKSEVSKKSGRSSRRSQSYSKSLPIAVPPPVVHSSKPSSKKAEDSSVVINTPGAISAGCTPKVARKIPTNPVVEKGAQQAKQPTPVSTAKGFVNAPRSEDVVSFCDEAAGRTPVALTESMLSSQKASGEVPNVSTMQTFTPAPDSSISTPAPRRPANPFRQ